MNGPRFNEWIQSPKVRVIDHEGENLGVMYTREAAAMARDVGLDLVEVSPGGKEPRIAADNADADAAIDCRRLQRLGNLG